MKFLKALTTVSTLALAVIYFWPNEEKLSHNEFNQYLENHPYNNTNLTPEQLKAIPKKDRPDLAWRQDFLKTLDPKLGRPAPERLYPTLEALNKPNSIYATNKTTNITWTERGPNNVGGRTRAIMFDPNDSTGKKVWAGAVAGGLWYNDDITLFNTSWVAVNDFWSNMAITSLAFDPTNTNVFYAGTGEGYGNLDAVRGDGIWKSTDGGATWAQLSSTTGNIFNYVRHIAVDPTNGDVYASTSTGGIQRSQDGGTTWTKVLGSQAGANTNSAYKVEISATGTVWAAMRAGGIYKSYSGDNGSYTKLNSTSNGFSPSPTSRVELAISQSDTNVCYAIGVSGTPHIFKTSDGGATWVATALPDDADFGIPSNDFTRGQHWYDLTIAVSPINSNHVVVGGIDIFQSLSGGSSWDQLSHWYGGFGYPEIHADQHNIVFRNDSSGLCIFSHDGGVSYCPDMTLTTPVLVSRIKDYNTTQFYACAVHPDAGSNYYLAGAQDNGTQQFTTPGINFTTEVTGGDGAFCFIDQDNPDWQITSYVYNNYRFSSDGGNTFSNFPSDQTGSFINPTDYHSNLNILFSGRSGGKIRRTFVNGNLNPTVDDFSSGTSGGTSHITVSPYTKSSATIFVGTSSGNAYKITNADGLSPSSSNISSNSFPSGSISCIAVGSSESELLVTFSNYGVNSIWYTSDGGANWVSKEGNLPDMPVRWALFNPNNNNNVIIATELGVWECTDLAATSPAWSASNTGLANVRVDMLRLRSSDGTVAAATHARGLFTTDAFFNPNPVANIGAHREIVCTNEDVKMNNLTTNATSYQWSVSPNTFNYVNGTSATSTNPEFEFTANGNYTITLVASNGTGQATTSTQLTVGTLDLPFNEDFSNQNFIKRWSVVNIDKDITWEERQVSGSTVLTVQNFNYVGASIFVQKDDLISPPLDFSGEDYPMLNFRFAYTSRTTQADSLGIFYSTDCGANWNHIATYSEDGSNSYRTTIPRNLSFTPLNINQWCGNGVYADCGYIDLGPWLANEPNVKIMFRNYSHNGNNLYLSDVNITSSSIGIPENAVSEFNLYPNPVNDIAVIDLGSKVSGDIQVNIFDLSGKLVSKSTLSESATGKVEIELSALNEGTYIMNVVTSTQTFNKKFIKR